jgi:hypothetical protein
MRGDGNERLAWATIVNNRILVSVAIGVLSGLLCLVINGPIGSERVDFMWSLYAARDLLAGRDVYSAHSSFDLIPYPFPAVLVALPLSRFTIPMGASVFIGATSGLLAYGLLRGGEWWRLLTFVSAPYYLAIRCVQWSPLMMAILFFPALMPLVLAKPQFALPVALTRMTQRRAVACLCFLLVSLAVYPAWPIRWFSQIKPYGGFIPALVFPVLLLPAYGWREPGIRHFLLMACMPQHRYLYDSLLLWVIPKSLAEMLVLTMSSWVACSAGFTLVGFRDHGAGLTVAGIYVPCLLLLLARSRSANQDATGRERRDGPGPL